MSFCERITPQEYKEQTLITSQRSLKDLLSRIVEDESVSQKERRKQLKQVCNTSKNMMQFNSGIQEGKDRKHTFCKYLVRPRTGTSTSFPESLGTRLWKPY